MTVMMGFIGILLMGFIITRFIGLKLSFLESLALGWLLGSVFMTSFLFWYGWLGRASFLVVLVMLMAVWFLRQLSADQEAQDSGEAGPSNLSLIMPFTPLNRVFFAGLWVLIIFQIFYALGSVLSLPTQYWDAYHFWHLKAKYFLTQGSLGLNDTSYWMLGGEKPHYPLHLPILKALVCILHGGWNDSWALGVDVINFSAFLIIVYCFIKRNCNSMAATITVYLISSLPLLGIHLSAGFGDLTVAVFLASSVIFWERWRQGEGEKHLLAGAFLLAAAAWTKNDALALFYPVILFASIFYGGWRTGFLGFTALMLPLVPWFLFKWIFNLSYNPNPSSGILEFHPEAVHFFSDDFFLFSGFGILWIMIIPLVFWRCKAGRSQGLWLVAWACMAMVLFVYMFTVNFEFLANSMTFQRSLLQIAPLFIIAMVMRVKDILQEK